MNLTVCIDGVEHAEVPLRDGDDAFNAAAERGALDRAYEAKESCPDAVVTILVDTSDEQPEPGEITLAVTRDEANSIAGALDMLAGVDEGENTDFDELIRLRDLILATPGVH